MVLNKLSLFGINCKQKLKHMANNTFVVDYTKRKLTIVFNYETIVFYLDEGDKGDFWEGFVTSDKKEWDINFHQEDETCEPSVEVYPAIWQGDENGSFEIDTNNGILLTCSEKIGSAEEYFNSIVIKDMEDVKNYLALLLAKINECGMGAWNADLENTVEAVALEDYYGDVESDEPTVKYNGWYEDLEKLVSSI